VRLVGPNGEQVGIVAINDALRLAQEADLDLVEVAPTARPPVCKLMDYGKFKYESALKARESRKHQAQTVIKEIKLRPKIDPHDYGTKKGHVERFLRQGDKVKVTIMFRGREQSRPDLGYRLLQRLAGDVEELGFVESQPKQDGRNMIMVIGPHKKKPETKAERTTPRPGTRAAAAAAEAETAPEVASHAPVAESAPRPVAEPAPRPAAEPAPRPAAEPARPAAESAPRPAAEPTPRPAAEPAPRPAAEPAPRPAAARPAAARPAAPRPAAPRPAAPRPAAPRPTAPAERPVPSPRPPRARPGQAVAAAKPAGNGADAATGT
jgi:translation initiation factor IF-3